jgi:prolyl-tRNA synthetase
MRRDQLRDGEKIRSHSATLDEFVAQVPQMLAKMQASLFEDAKARLHSNIVSGVKTYDELREFFGATSGDEDEGVEFRGWVRAPWSRPSGERLEKVDADLKKLKLTLRNAPSDQAPSSGRCLFTGEAAVEEVLIARAY